MNFIKDKFGRFRRWQHAWLAIIIIASAVLHLGLLWFPNELVLDEQYYIVSARDYLEQGDLHQGEHPPLAKFFITAGMQIFGDNQFGWRIMPLLFGLLTIFFFYLICRQLKFSNTVTNIATALLAFENSTFLMASVAMLDIFSVALMLGGFWAYLARKYPISIAFFALAALCKLTALFGLSAIGLHWLFFRRDQALTLAVSGLAAYAGMLLLIPGLEFILTGEWQNPIDRAGTLITTPTTITFETSSHPYAVHPWDWVLGYQVMPFWWDPQYISAVNPTIWAMTLPVFFWTAWLGLSRKHEAAFFAAAWIFATLIVWIILGAITDRITYIFYFVPIVGGVTLGLAVFMEKAFNWARRPSAQYLADLNQAESGIEVSEYPMDASPVVESAGARYKGAEGIVPYFEAVGPSIPGDVLSETKKRSIIVYAGMGIFLAAHLIFFLALTPFTGWWPVTVT